MCCSVKVYSPHFPQSSALMWKMPVKGPLNQCSSQDNFVLINPIFQTNPVAVKWIKKSLILDEMCMKNVILHFIILHFEKCQTLQQVYKMA